MELKELREEAIYYCYNHNCPARTKVEPWPRSDGEYKSVKLTSKKGTPYYRKRMICKHCGSMMYGVASMHTSE